MGAKKVTPSELVLALDAGAIISAEKDERVEATIRKFLAEGARIVIPVPVIAECIRGGPTDAVANRLIKAINNVVPTSEAIARAAGARLGATGSSETIDALVVASAEAAGANNILTTDPTDIGRLNNETLNIIGLT
jgi:predicted nucleic acid-binding protein